MKGRVELPGFSGQLIKHMRSSIRTAPKFGNSMIDEAAYVKQFNVLKDLRACVVSRLIITMVNDFVL
jgi:hypothetical protein